MSWRGCSHTSVIPTPRRSSTNLYAVPPWGGAVLSAAWGRGPRRPGTCPPLPPLRSGRGAPAGSPPLAATAVCGRPRRFPARPFFAGGRPCGAARPLAARAAIAYAPPPAPPPRPLRGFGVVGPSAGGAAVPSPVDALALCPLLPGWPPGGRSAPGSRPPVRRGSPRRSRRRRSGPGGPRGAAAATGRLGRRCRPARAPGPLFLCSCCGFLSPRWAGGQRTKNGRNRAKNGENRRK